jgi:hypothetical protein
MKKFLLLVIVVLGLFTIDHPMIKEPRETFLNQGVDILSESSKVQRSPAAKHARDAINRTLSLNTDVQSYIDDALATDDKLKEFHLRYCSENDANRYLYGATLIQVCDITAEALHQAKEM